MKRALAIFSISFLLCHAAGAQTSENERSQTKPAQRIVRFYPNPASESIYFDWKSSFRQPLQLRIFNFLGKPMLELSRLGATTKVDLTTFKRGLYLFQVVDARGQVMESGKFQVEK